MSNIGKKAACLNGNLPQSVDNIFYRKNKKREALKKSLKEIMVELIEKEGVNYFISGMNKGVDLLGAEIVLELKRIYPDIALECVLPYENQASEWSESLRDKYFNVIEHSDKEVLLQTRYTDDCMSRLNQYLTDVSDFVITVGDGENFEVKRNCEWKKFECLT